MGDGGSELLWEVKASLPQSIPAPTVAQRGASHRAAQAVCAFLCSSQPRRPRLLWAPHLLLLAHMGIPHSHRAAWLKGLPAIWPLFCGPCLAFLLCRVLFSPQNLGNPIFSAASPTVSTSGPASFLANSTRAQEAEPVLPRAPVLCSTPSWAEKCTQMSQADAS